MPHNGHINIVSINIHPRDAIGNYVLEQQKLFEKNGFQCRLYAQGFPKEWADKIFPVETLLENCSPDAIVLFHFSIYDKFMEHIAKLKCKKILYYHNITPSSYFAPYHAVFADHLDYSRTLIPLVEHFDHIFTNSAYSARDLADEFATRSSGEGLSKQLIPLPPVLGKMSWEDHVAGETTHPIPYLLCVGRIAPHKKVEDVVQIFEAISSKEKKLDLIIVGSEFPGYGEAVHEGINALPTETSNRIFHKKELSDEELHGLYANAAGLITMSEHEGFCVPLMEAMHHNIPIFAYAQEGISETLGDSGKLYKVKDFEHIASDILATFKKKNELDSILQKQRTRLKELLQLASGKTLLTTIHEVSQS